LPKQGSRNANSFAFYANTNRNSIKVAIKRGSTLTSIWDYLTVAKTRVEYPRINERLSEYLPILSTGLNLLSACWEFPAEPDTKRVRVRVRLDDTMGAQLDYITEHSKKSKAAVITAALIHAKNSNRRPPACTSKKKGREPANPNDAN
jgi:hypothetical protein